MAERRRHYIAGPKLIATDEWKRQVLRRIEELGTNVREVEVAIGCGAASLDKLLKSSQRKSALVELVSGHLGVPLPAPITDEEMALALDIRSLGDAEKQLILDYIAKAKASAKR